MFCYRVQFAVSHKAEEMLIAVIIVVLGSAMLGFAHCLSVRSSTLSCYYRGDPRKRRSRLDRVVRVLCSILSCPSTKEGLETLAVGSAIIGMVLIATPAFYLLVVSVFAVVFEPTL